MNEHDDLAAARRPSAQRSKKEQRKEVLDWIVTLLSALLIALVLRMFIFEFIDVKGPSMNPTLYTGERVLITKGPYFWFGGPKRGDIIVTRFPQCEPYYIKRVIALPGETFEIHDDRVYINGEPLAEDYIFEPFMSDYPLITVPEGHYMVLGDNRNDSTDSRAGSVGALPEEMLVGKATCVVWPLKDIQGLSFSSDEE